MAGRADPPRPRSWDVQPRLKPHGLPGNVAVAVLASLPFLYGAAAVDEVGKGVLLVAVATPLHFAREVVKDLDDMSADAGIRRTLPVTAGLASARAAVLGGVAAYSVAVILVATAYPLFALLLVPTILLAVLAVHVYYRDRAGAAARLKAAMVLAIPALVVSAADRVCHHMEKRMTVWQAISSGVLQGLDGVSSDQQLGTPRAHTMILGWQSPGLAFDVALTGTLAAVLWFSEHSGSRLLGRLAHRGHAAPRD